ncbi:neuroligin-1-like [Macrosteles quadrilineatus]|uniref:neuroligin-1-like n=1 Tax=Macrosteles quadrilineatus TaxID=74068 RepID=UPI0023E2F5E4|nr:neuroligin-1-like [Macrosteles quadrilineatus]
MLASRGRIVVVTVNYRLGVLGFLPIGRHSNLGLQDLVAALRWVKENIVGFGGDPEAVTLAGHGSGAECVHWLMMSPSVQYGSLFHRVIMMSGAAHPPVRNPQEVVFATARHLNCPLDHRLTHCLRETPLESLLSVPVAVSTFATPFGPVEDGVVVVSSQNYFREKSHRMKNHHLRRSSREENLTRGSKKYDMLFGLVRAEALFYFSEYDLLFGIENDKKIHLLESFVNETYRYHTAEILATLVNEYTSWERPVQHPANILRDTEEALSDGRVAAPLVRAAEAHSGGSYMYLFSHQTRASDYSKQLGSIHGEELCYLFPNSDFLSRNLTKAELHLSQTFVSYVANFVKTGDPNRADHQNHSKHRRSHRLAWLPYDKLHKRYMMLDTRSKMKDHYRAHRLSFWLNLVPQLQQSDDNQLENNAS